MTEKESISQQPYALWLHGVERIGKTGAQKLVDYFGSPKEVYEAGEKELAAVLTPGVLESMLHAKKRDVHGEYESLTKSGISFIPFYHSLYPEKLYAIPDRPFGVFVKGSLPGKGEKSVAIIGARDCSEYGRYVAECFAGELAGKGIRIISGMARGIDGIAGRKALDAGGKTYAVLGCGVDICYPSSHRNLYRDICDRGGVLSEYPPKTEPHPGHFPPRNRIISGLADAVLVIEARLKSGTLITVDMALEQGREVYVVPGRITDRLSDGCNRLLLQGAGAAISPAQLVKELSETVWKGQWNNEAKAAVPEEEEKHLEKLQETEKALLQLLDFYPVSMAQLRLKMQSHKLLCGLSLQQTIEMLLMLCMEGVVKNEGGYYCLKNPL
mgnify:CR=1 FL=1